MIWYCEDHVFNLGFVLGSEMQPKAKSMFTLANNLDIPGRYNKNTLKNDTV